VIKTSVGAPKVALRFHLEHRGDWLEWQIRLIGLGDDYFTKNLIGDEYRVTRVDLEVENKVVVGWDNNLQSKILYWDQLDIGLVQHYIRNLKYWDIELIGQNRRAIVDDKYQFVQYEQW
jgi:hypothetical protein